MWYEITCASDPCQSVLAGEVPDMRLGDTCLLCLCRECERCGKSIDIDEENQIKHVPDREHPHDYGYWDVCDDCLFDSDVLYDDELEAERREEMTIDPRLFNPGDMSSADIATMLLDMKD